MFDKCSVAEIHGSSKRDNSLLKIRFVSSFYGILQLRDYLARMNNLPKQHGAGHNAPASVTSA